VIVVPLSCGDGQLRRFSLCYARVTNDGVNDVGRSMEMQQQPDVTNGHMIDPKDACCVGGEAKRLILIVLQLSAGKFDFTLSIGRGDEVSRRWDNPAGDAARAAQLELPDSMRSSKAPSGPLLVFLQE
jgi:hypothetical protein